MRPREARCCSAPVRRLSLIASSSSARPSARRPCSAEAEPRPAAIASQVEPVAGGTTEGQALLQHLDGGLQVPLGEVQLAETTVGNDRCVPSAFPRGEAERLLPVAPALGEGPECAQGPRQPRPGLDPHVCTGRARLPGPPPPRSTAAARPPGRSRRWHSRPAPGNRMLAPARRDRRARPRARGPAGPPQWRRRGLPCSCVHGPSLASTRPSRARSSSARARASASPNRARRRPYSPRWLSEPPNARRRSMASHPGVAVLGQVREGLEGLLEGGHRLAERGAVVGPGAGLLASRSRPCPTPRPAGHGGPAGRPARPPGPRRALPGPRRCGHAAPAADPGANSHRPPAG